MALGLLFQGMPRVKIAITDAKWTRDNRSFKIIATPITWAGFRDNGHPVVEVPFIPTPFTRHIFNESITNLSGHYYEFKIKGTFIDPANANPPKEVESRGQRLFVPRN